MAAKKKVTVPTELITDEMREAGVDETTPMITKEEARKELSKAQLEFVAMMESYKKSNPAKYAQKEEGFIKKLNSL